MDMKASAEKREWWWVGSLRQEEIREIPKAFKDEEEARKIKEHGRKCKCTSKTEKKRKNDESYWLIKSDKSNEGETGCVRQVPTQLTEVQWRRGDDFKASQPPRSGLGLDFPWGGDCGGPLVFAPYTLTERYTYTKEIRAKNHIRKQ